ncbi:hypothetical protein L6452_17636 [Arctium lappa]|uniref:Uncharacterized protein n=1 Tax=Arctium lappa TaxID=4217 RepID=A0ACB9C3Y1_ARCLA|nr:hypothetical protein L6452_17636 [Arctium lappa]
MYDPLEVWWWKWLLARSIGTSLRKSNNNFLATVCQVARNGAYAGRSKMGAVHHGFCFHVARDGLEVHMLEWLCSSLVLFSSCRKWKQSGAEELMVVVVVVGSENGGAGDGGR